MEQQETPASVTTRSAGIRYGVISAIISIAYFVILNIAGLDMTQGVWRWAGWVITIAIIFMAHKYYKDYGDGFMSYGQGIGISFWIGTISGVISSIFMYIYVKFIDTGFIDMMKEKQIEQFQENNMSDEQIEQAMEFSAMFMTPEAFLIFGIIGGIITAIIIGLLVTVFTQKKNPDPIY